MEILVFVVVTVVAGAVVLREINRFTRRLSRFFPSSKPRQYRRERAKQSPPRADPLPVEEGDVVEGKAWVIDGDTIDIRGYRIRIWGIDAPEMEHPWGKTSKSAMIRLTMGQLVTAEFVDHMSYDRLVAKCYLSDGTDLAAELVKQGMALDWPKFSGGLYRHLEPPDARKKLWRCEARMRGNIAAIERAEQKRRMKRGT